MHCPSAEGLQACIYCRAAKLTRNLRLFGMQVMHTAIRALTVVLQQWHNQLPVISLPLNVIKQQSHSRISYCADHVLKMVDWATFQNVDLPSLTLMYDMLLAIPCGAHLQHPRGLIGPVSQPKLGDDGIWRHWAGHARQTTCHTCPASS